MAGADWRSEARPGALGGARSRITIFPTLTSTSAAADRKVGTSSVPAPTPTDENRARRGLFQAEASRMSSSEPSPAVIGSPAPFGGRCFALRPALCLLARITLLVLAFLHSLASILDAGSAGS